MMIFYDSSTGNYACSKLIKVDKIYEGVATFVQMVGKMIFVVGNEKISANNFGSNQVSFFIFWQFY